MRFPDRIVALHHDLDRAELPHAFGGAIALAFCIAEARATIDVDINVFVPVDRVDDVFRAIASHVPADEQDRDRTIRDGQVRLWWDRTAVDLFFSYHAFHRQAAARVRFVPFSGVDIPVLDCTDLLVFKVAFGRPKDWADIIAIADIGSADAALAASWVGELLGTESHAYRRLARIFAGEEDRGGDGLDVFGRPDDDR